MKVNMQKFMEQYRKEYRFLYDNAGKGCVAGYNEAVREFDDLLASSESFREFVRKFAEYRSDPVSSDREAAAFMFALAEVSC